MAKPLRIEYPGALYHVTSRGNERRPIALDDHDRLRRLDWLRRTVEMFGWHLHAFVLMSNHDHLFVETPEPNLARGMQFFNGSYTGGFNRRHRRAGHLFQGRYQAILIESQGHYQEVSRYIHLNPVRAGLAGDPKDWRWSSYGGYYRAQAKPAWLTCERVLKESGAVEASARKGYRRFVLSGIGEKDSPWQRLAHGIILGSELFVAEVRRRLEERPDDPDVPILRRMRARPPLERIIAAVAEHYRIERADWRAGSRSDDLGRAVAAHLARRHGYGASETAQALGYRRHSSVAQACRRVAGAGARLASTLRALEARLPPND